MRDLGKPVLPRNWKAPFLTKKPKFKLKRKDAIMMTFWLGVVSAVPIGSWVAFGNTHDIASLVGGVAVFVVFYLMVLMHYLKKS